MRAVNRSRKDANHHALVKRFRELGCSVIETHDTGIPGFPDLVVGCIGTNRLVELKNPATAYGRHGLNARQMAFNQDWRGERLYVVSSADEATVVVQNWRRSA